VRDATAAAYDTAGAAYRAWSWSQFWDACEKDLVFRKVPAQGRILDAGCGFGRYAGSAAKRGLQYFGIDVSEVQLALARSALPDLTPRLIVGDIARMPFADETFDVVVCTRVLNHGVALDVVAHEFARVLRPHGQLIITDISEAHRYHHATIPAVGGGVALPVSRYRRNALVGALRAAAFSIGESRTVDELAGADGRALLDLTTARKIA
jgi:SAM-dependent methyltransferase